MNTTRATPIRSLFCVTAILLCQLLSQPVRSQAQDQPAIDPAVWGFYTQLAGTTKKISDEYYMLRWDWKVPGVELLEQYLEPRTQKVKYTTVITKGAQPGELQVKGLAGKIWIGTRQPDGSVVYIGQGMLKLPYRVSLDSEGVYEYRGVKLRDGKVASIDPPSRNSIYRPIDGAPQSHALAQASSPGSAGSHTASASAPAASDSADSQPASAHPQPAAALAGKQTSSRPRAVADAAVWGDYARVIGVSLGGAEIFRLGANGTELVRYRGLHAAAPVVATYVPAGDGKLSSYENGQLVASGTIQSDGSVLWEGNPSWRFKVTEQGVVIEDVRLQEGQVAEVTRRVEIAAGFTDRWGVLAGMVGGQWARQSPIPGFLTYGWFDPNRVLLETFTPILGRGEPTHFFITWDEKLQKLVAKAGSETRRGEVAADGSVTFTRTGLLLRGTYRYSAEAGGVSLDERAGGGRSQEVMFPLDKDDAQQFTSGVLETHWADRRAAHKRSMARWDAVNSFMGAMNGALSEVSEVTAANAAQAQADLQATLDRQARAAQERELAAARASVPQQTQTAQETPASANSTARSQEAAAADVRQASATSQAAAKAPSRGSSFGESSERDSASEERQNLIATPEAILVCTKPDSKGNFECDTPVDTNLRGGPNNGLEAWKTPDSLIAWASASCPGAHRLPSTTHLVWGCGFGATGNSNSMDRSGGVDVQGRATYYCSERQTSCRRTAP